MISLARSLLATPWFVLGLKLVIVTGVVLAVGESVRDAWAQLSAEQLRVDLGLALAGGLLFLVAMLPMAWFWRRTLRALGQPAPWGNAILAFYVSQIGKYVPGKAMVVLIRAERMLRSGGSRRLVVAAVFLETLTVMAVGALLAALLITLEPMAEASHEGTRWLVPLALLLASLCLVPTAPPVAERILERLVPEEASRKRDPVHFSWKVVAQGWGAALLTWLGFGASVWLIAWAVGAAGAGDWQHVGLWVLAAALPTVAGFLSLLPGGLVVRDGLMLLLLTPQLGEGGALATTIAVRLIWIVSEAVLCAILVGVVDPPWKGSSDDPPGGRTESQE